MPLGKICVQNSFNSFEQPLVDVTKFYRNVVMNGRLGHAENGRNPSNRGVFSYNVFGFFYNSSVDIAIHNLSPYDYLY